MLVLLADDDPASRMLLAAALNRLGFTVVQAADGREALRILEGPDPPRLVLLDWEMPGATGIELCRWIRQAGDEPYTWVVMLTGRNNMGDVVEAMDAGADSFIHKPVGMEELKARLRPGLRMLELQHMLIQAREEYRYQACHDELTGLLSRKAALDTLRSALEKGPVALAMVDVDHFKRVNDTWGHEAGDRVLRQVASELRRAVRPEDFLGRLGGEEFLVILPGCDVREGQRVGERLRSRMEASRLEVDGTAETVTVSVGVAAGRHPGEFAELLKDVDRALYSAKRAGRNRVAVSTWQRPSLDQAS